MTKAKIVLLLACGGLLTGSASADIRLPPLIGDGMVLQRDARIPLWGWANPRESVRIDFRGEVFRIQADRKGQWSVSLGPYPAGGPFRLTLMGENIITLRDVLIGDVWLASGQSNMEWPLKGPGASINHADDEIAEAKFPNIRLFRVYHKTSPRLESEAAAEGWRAVTPESVPGFSAVAYLFGRELHQRYGVPIGLIQSTWGGTVAEAWISKRALRSFPAFHDPIRALGSVTPAAEMDYEHFMQRKTAWYQQHMNEDRGRVDGRDVWADPKLDVSAWPTISLPREWAECGKDFDGFSGVVWFRRTISVPVEEVGKPLFLHLGRLVQEDTTYFNGIKLGETRGFGKQRHYRVPAQHVTPGENTLTVRLTGPNNPTSACAAMIGPTEQMMAQIGATRIPINGTWAYRSGPDLRDFPRVDPTTLAANPSPNTPTALFNGMISPLLPNRIKGVIWYQGESNAYRAVQYRRLFPALIQDWRHQWGYEFPFLFVQLAGFGANKAEPADYSWAELREAQSMALSLPATGMATAIDIGDEENIHPSNKQDVATRLVLVAAKVAYAEDILHSGPMYRSMQLEGARIRIKFYHLGSGLLIHDKYGYVRGFEIAAADGKFRWAQAEQDGSDIMVFSQHVREPRMVRYAWSNTPDGNVFNNEGLPAIPFRTDAPKN